MLWFNLFQKLQKEEIEFIRKPTLKGNKKTNAFSKLKKKKKTQSNATVSETNCISVLLLPVSFPLVETIFHNNICNYNIV